MVVCIIQAGTPDPTTPAGKTSKHSGVRGKLTSNFRPEEGGGGGLDRVGGGWGVIKNKNLGVVNTIISNFNYFRPKWWWFFCPASCVFLLHIGLETTTLQI